MCTNGCSPSWSRTSKSSANLRLSGASLVAGPRNYGNSPGGWCGRGQVGEGGGWVGGEGVEEVVMEWGAQYWKPVWASLERDWKPLAQQWAGAGRMAGTLHLAQAQSNRARPGRKRDFTDAERLVK